VGFGTHAPRYRERAGMSHSAGPASIEEVP
jgi:hypothetical protein